MLRTALPNLSPLEYDRANDLCKEIVAAKTYVEMHPGAAGPINGVLNFAAGLPAAGAVVVNNLTKPLLKSDGTALSPAVNTQASVADNFFNGMKLPATVAALATGVVLNVTGGGTVTLTIANNAVTGVAYTAPA